MAKAQDRSRSGGRDDRRESKPSGNEDLIRALEQYGVAKSSDVQSLRQDVAEVQKDVQSLRTDHEDVKNRVGDLETKFAEMAKPSGSKEAAPNSGLTFPSPGLGGQGGGQGEWKPQHVRVQGFAPFNCPKTDMLRRDDYEKFGKRLLDALPAHGRHLVTLLPPGPYNFRITFKVVGGSDNCTVVVNYLRNFIERESLQILGHTPKVSVELPPHRRGPFNAWHRAREAFECVDASTWEHDGRTLSILRKSDFATAGSWDDKEGRWHWNAEVCQAMGFDHESHPIAPKQ